MAKLENIPQALKDRPRWVLWRYLKRNGKPSKVPYQVNGRFAKSDSPETWTNFETAVANLEGNEGLGFVFNGDGLVGVDLDCCLEDDGVTVKPWALEIIEALGATYVERSPSLIGLKAFGVGRIGDRGKAWAVPGDPQGRVEIYDCGRYFTVTGDRWPGSAETVEDISEALGLIIDRFDRPAAPPRVTKPSTAKSPAKRPPAFERAMAWAAHTPGAVSGQQGHRHTYHVAQTLVNGFDLGVDAAREVLQAWNQLCSPPWSDKELEHKLAEAWKARNPATVGDMLGHREDFGQQFFTVEDLEETTAKPEDLEEVEPVLEFVGRSRGSATFPERLLEVPGFVGEVADWITSQNPRKNRILSLTAAIGLQCVLAGRKVRDKGGSRTNLYLVSIAPSGGGKQAPQTCVQKILSLSSQSDLYGGKVASDSALAADLVASPAKLYLWDEFGRFLAKMHQDRGGVHVHAIQEALLELWGSTGTLWKHKSLADSKLNREVDQPCLTFLGSTVPGHFWGGLEEDHLQDGFAGRLMVIDTGPAAPTADVTETPPPESILEAARWWKAYHPGGNLDGVHPEPAIVAETPAASELFRGLVRTSETHLDNDTDAAVWSRAVEKARRLALVYAVSRDRLAPCIDDVAARWAIDLVIWATETFLARVKDEVAPSGMLEERWRRVKRTIEGYTKHRQLCERSALLRACKWPARELDRILESMVEAGVVTVHHVQAGRGPAKRHYSLR